jgi:hypothetical protein
MWLTCVTRHHLTIYHERHLLKVGELLELLGANFKLCVLEYSFFF